MSLKKRKVLDSYLEDLNASENVEVFEEETSLEKEEIADRQQDRDERKKYASLSFDFLCAFTSIVLLIIIASAMSEILYFKLSDTVLITLITTSLATIVGIFILVMKYLFSK